jgi:hypothetical protein
LQTEVASVVKMAVEETDNLGKARIKMEGLFQLRETILTIGIDNRDYRHFKNVWRHLVR